MKELVQKNIPELRNLIDDKYASNKLREFHKYFLKDFIEKNPNLEAKYHLPEIPVKPKKADLVELYVLFFINEELFRGLLSTLSETTQTLLKNAIWGAHLHQDALEKEYKVQILKPYKKGKKASQDYVEIEPEYYIFNDSSRYRHWDSWKDSAKKESRFIHILYIHRVLAKHLKEFIEKPEGYYLESLTEIKETTCRFNAEKLIFQEFPIVNAYVQQKRLATTTTGRITDAALNKMKKFCNTQEFFAEAKDKTIANYRIRGLAIAALYWNEAHSSENLPLEKVIEKIFHGFSQGQIEPEAFLSHLKGWQNVQTNNMVSKDILRVLNDFPTEGWVAMDSLKKYIVYRDIDFEFFTYKYDMNYISISVKYSRSYTDNVKVSSNNYGILLIYPYIRNCLAFFASLGMLEIAYDYPYTLGEGIEGRDFIVPGDDIKYIRLTSLGAFLLGKTYSYTPPEIKEDRVTLDKDNLLMLYQGENKSLISMIESIAVNVSKNLYKVSFETVLGNCNNVKEVETQVNVFKQVLSKNPPEIWQEFFSALQQKSYQLENQNDAYSIYQLPDNPELVRLIAKDEFLRKHVVRAEYHNILVPNKHKSKIKKYLKKSGFLIEFD